MYATGLYRRLLARRELSSEVPVQLLVQQGRTAREAVKAAKGICADLILVHLPRQNWFFRLFSGGPTRWIQSHAPCTVVVLREANCGACDCSADFESRPANTAAIPA